MVAWDRCFDFYIDSGCKTAFAAINVSPDGLLINDCVERVRCAEGERSGRRGLRRANEQKARREAQRIKDGAMSGTRVGWMGLGMIPTSNHNLLCVIPPCNPNQPGHLCHPRSHSVSAAASLHVFTLWTPINAVRPLLCPRWSLYQSLLTMFQKLSLPCLTRLGSAQIILKFV
jgi:hypothetical protein